MVGAWCCAAPLDALQARCDEPKGPPPKSQVSATVTNQWFISRPMANRAEVGVNQAVNLAGKVEMPPGAGKVVQYDCILAALISSTSRQES